MIEITKKREEASNFMSLAEKDKEQLIKDLDECRKALQSLITDSESTRSRYEASLGEAMTKNAQHLAVITDLEKELDLINDENTELKKSVANLSSILSASQIPFNPLFNSNSLTGEGGHNKEIHNCTS